ncbi:MAG: regulatory protein RecX [Gammaproteobacteria bacterium]|nr:regulatory protein RecX [Gammaproteobacteria bacterium]
MTDYVIQAKNICIQLLSRREYSQKELQQKLSSQEFPQDVITNCLDSLRENNYQSDDRYAEMFIRTRFNQRYGPKKINFELKQKGIDETVIKRYLSEYHDEWLDNVILLIERKAPRGDIGLIFSDRKVKDKITRFLIGKGYDYATISLAFETLQDTHELS